MKYLTSHGRARLAALMLLSLSAVGLRAQTYKLVIADNSSLTNAKEYTMHADRHRIDNNNTTGNLSTTLFSLGLKQDELPASSDGYLYWRIEGGKYTMEAPTDATCYVYFNNTNNWTKVYAYAWNDNSDKNANWPGEEMEKLDNGLYIWKAKNNKTFAKIIFNVGSNATQTGDLTLTTGNIYDANGSSSAQYQYFAPSQADYALGTTNPSWSSKNNHGDTNGNDAAKDIYNYESYTCSNTSTKGSNCFKLKRDEGVSYTFGVNASTEGHTTNYNRVMTYTGTSVQLQINRRPYKTDGEGYYLIGNLTNATGNGSWNPSGSDRRSMTRLVYNNPQNTEQVDSVVYEVSITKPAKGFDELYLGFIAKEQFDNGQWTGSDADWQDVIRPTAHDAINQNGTGGYDSPALHGALMRFSDINGYTNSSNNTYNASDAKQYSGQQAINPQLTDEQKAKYTSYTVRFNATTKTYSVVFNEGLYIVGSAVKGAQNAWNLAQAQQLSYDSSKKCYTGKVTLKQGGKFVFVKDKSYQYTYFEDNDAPAGTDYAPATLDGDVFYNNQIVYNTDAERTSVDDNTSNVILFKTPELQGNEEAEYEIHFYENMPDDPSSSEPFYTLNRKVKLVKNPKPGDGNTNNVLRAFACNYPLEYDDTALKLYVVDSYDKTNMTVHLKDVTDTYKVNNDQAYIPAKVPVLLIKTDSTDTQAEGNALYLSCRPFINLNASNAYNGTNLLEGIYTLDNRTIYFTYPTTTHGTNDDAWTTGENVEARGYLFQLLKQAGTDNSYTYVPAFRRAKSGESTTERAFLKVTSSTSDNDTTFNPADKTSYAYNAGGNAIDASTAQSAKLAYLLDFSDETTGITTVQPAQTDDNTWYNLGGQRVSQPAKGVYIHQGRKVVVK